MADIFAEDLAGEEIESIKAAFTRHRRRSPRFPTPAHILALMPDCRVCPTAYALPERPLGKKTPGMGRLAFDAHKGDQDARKKMAALINRCVEAASA